MVLQSSGNCKYQNISRNNSLSHKIINNNYNILSTIKEKDSFFDISNERDFNSQLLNKKYNRKLISKSVTTTIKYQYKSSNCKYETNKIQNSSNTINNDKYSTILRSQSSILNKRLNNNYFNNNKKTISNYEINNYNNKKSKKNNQKKKTKNEEKSAGCSPQKRCNDFNLSKFCNSSHPKNNNNNNINVNYINNEYTFIKNYTLKYNYEENIDFLNNENTIHKYENNDKNKIIVNENKMIDNKENQCKNKDQNENEQNISILLLPESSNKKDKAKNKREIYKSFSSKNVKDNYHSQKNLKNNDETKYNFIFNKYNENKNKNKFFYSANNLKKSKLNNQTFNIEKNIKIYLPRNHKDKIYYFRNNDKQLENSKNNYTYKYNKNMRNQFLKKLHNFNEQYSNNYSKHNTFSEKTINIIKKFGSKDNIKCVMPANNLRNILFKNENELFFNTNNPSKIF